MQTELNGLTEPLTPAPDGLDLDELFGEGAEPTLADPDYALSEAEAEAMVDRILSAKARAKRIREQAAAMVKKADERAAWLENFYGPQLEAFAKRAIAGRRDKYCDLLTGRVGFRAQPAGVKLEFADDALTWAKANLPAAVETKESLSWSTLKDALAVGGDGATVVVAETGEAVGGFCRVEPATEKLYVK